MYHLRDLMPSPAATTPPSGGDELRRFIEEHAEGLRHAADLLGGPRHAKAVDELVDLLSREPTLGRRARRLLDELLQLLSLELVDDLESEEAAIFSTISPDHPAVMEICALTDGLRSAIAGARHEMWPAPCPGLLPAA